MGRAEGGAVSLDWTETGGERLMDVPERTGFGSRMVDHTVRSAFGGAVSRTVQDGGLAVRLSLDEAALTADG